jgi:uncharacterized membrane protein
MTTIHLIIVITIGGIAIIHALVLWFMPRLTRRDLYFAVTVVPGFRDEPESRSILRRYRIELMVASALAAVVFVVGVANFGVGFVSAGFFIQLAALFIPFYRARLRVLPYAVPPTMIREAELHDHNRIIPGGWTVAMGPFILLVACAGYLWIHPTKASTRLASHWGGEQLTRLPFHGLSIYLVSTAGILAAFTLILYGLVHWVRPVHAGGPERTRELKFRRTVAAILVVTEYYITLQASWIMLVPRRNDLTTVGLLPLAFVFAMVATILLARLGQGGSRMPAAVETQLTSSSVPVGDRTLDRYWRLGIIYFNRHDPAVLVEKRFGLGYSLNFARPIAWIIVLLVLMGPLVPILAHLYL